MTDQVIGRQSAHATIDFFDDQHPPLGDFMRDVEDGLSASPRSIPPVYFYDQEGSALFDKITELPEYYVTRTELELLGTISGELSLRAGAGAVVIEPGSGSSVKIRTLLDALGDASGYVGLDISRDHLVAACEELARDYPNVTIGAVCANFTTGLQLDHLPLPEGRRLIFFPGSTIGNFEPVDARAVLAGFRSGMRKGDAVLIGADRVKDEQILVEAYDDAAGITAAFNLNLLKRIKTELGARLNAEDFSHKSIWNSELQRIEMHLVATRRTEIELNGKTHVFEAGETLHTENSHKFTPTSFELLAESAGYTVVKHWSDPAELFSLYWLEPNWEA